MDDDGAPAGNYLCPDPICNDLFWACFRIQAEASEATGHHIPLIVENVKGAQPWVGRAKWHYRSFYLWGDVPALMPSTRRFKGRTNFHVYEKTGLPSPSYHGAEHEAAVQRAMGLKVPGIKLSKVGFNVATAQRYREEIKGNVPRGDGERPSGTGASSWFFKQRADPRDSQGAAVTLGTKNNRGSWFAEAHNTESGKGQNPVHDGFKQAGLSGPAWFDHGAAHCSSKSDSRKAASAQIAKIPPDLARWIARCFKPPA